MIAMSLSILAMAISAFTLGWLSAMRTYRRPAWPTTPPGGVIECRHNLSPRARARLRDEWEKYYRGPGK